MVLGESDDKSGADNVAVGKPVKCGGIENYDRSASQGVLFGLEYFLNNDKMVEMVGFEKKGLADKTFIIQVFY